MRLVEFNAAVPPVVLKANDRRAGHWPDLQKAKGVAAYAEAFQHSFANCIRKPEDQTQFEPTSGLGTYDFKHIKDSIEVSIAENAAGRSAVWQGAALAMRSGRQFPLHLRSRWRQRQFLNRLDSRSSGRVAKASVS